MDQNQTEGDCFAERLEQARSWLVLLARLHLDRRLPDQDASDMAHEALCDAVKYRNKIESLETTELQYWLRRVLRNKVIDFYRKRRPQVAEADLGRLEGDIHDSFQRIDRLAVESASSPSEHAVKQEQLLQLANGLETLPEDLRRVIVLRDLSGWPLQQSPTRWSVPSDQSLANSGERDRNYKRCF